MPVVDNPTWRHWPVLAHSLAHGDQRYGQFVLVRIDTVASVAVLDDAEASRAAALIPHDWFLGIVINPAHLRVRDAEGVSLLDLSIYLVGVGPPEPAHAAIPIPPAPQLTDGHPPVKLSSDAALPWPNLYAHSFYFLNVVIKRLHDGPDYFPVCLAKEQVHDFRALTIGDQYDRSHAAYAEWVLKNAAARQAHAAAASATGDESESASDSERPGTGSAGSDDFMFSEDAQAVNELYEKAYRFQAELWVGPTAECPGEPAPPSACRAAIIRLNEIVDEWYDRKIAEAKARRSQVIADWSQSVREVAGARVERPDAEAVQSVHAAAADESIAPEDAIDSHAERRTSVNIPYECTESPKQEDSLPGPSPAEPQPTSVDLNGLETAQHASAGTGGVPPPAPQQAQACPTVCVADELRLSTERAGSQTLEAQAAVEKDFKLAPPAPLPQLPTNVMVPAKSPGRNRLASLNRVAMKWFRSVIVRTKA